MLAALQRGIPIDRRPFAVLGRSLGIEGHELVTAVSIARQAGIVRRFGAVFDVRRLGYRSALCALAVPIDQMDEVATRIVPLSSVTHCYQREAFDTTSNFPNLWFTLSLPRDKFDQGVTQVGELVAPFALQVLPATKRYKVDVVFGAATRAYEESTRDELPPPDALERKIIVALQGDTEVREDYFAALAEKIGMPEWELLAKLELWRRNGRLKRIGMLLNHQQAGYSVNGMCCWQVSGDTLLSGRALAASPYVTHCYERPRIPNFPYNLFAMIHCRSRSEADDQFAELSALPELHNAPRTMLVSTHQYKKTSMTFFV